ncbi:hypothetical protein DASC09_013020 [Saccharomycopsis crataegensis]|uniref:Uncharacterized protein n=1 Tax=Saccharomycopsis crataegensis TaxID=43959 RepID=A0AAV5QH99_9ASCO|nr:hypothetical protein DASC09_013020 [Saccharomycopsis crataegensis]
MMKPQHRKVSTKYPPGKPGPYPANVRPHQQQLLQHQIKRPASQIANSSSFHDEAEVMNFKQSLAQRFIQNQELLEVILEKNVPLKNIIPPAPYPEPKQHNIDDPMSVWIGSLDSVKQQIERNNVECDTLKSDDQHSTVLDPQFMERGKLLRKLRHLDTTNLDEMNENMMDIMGQFEATSDSKKFFRDSNCIKKSIDKLKPKNYSEAPANWYQRQEQIKLEIQKKYEEEMKRKAVEEEEARRLQEQAQRQQQSIISHGSQLSNIQQHPVVAGGADSMTFGYDSNIPGGLNNDVFNNEMAGFIDDNEFGIQSALDDNDFLSQIDHSME